MYFSKMPSLNPNNSFRKGESLSYRTNLDTVAYRMWYEAFLRGFSVQNASPQPLTDPQELSKVLGSKMSLCWLGWDSCLLSSFVRCTNNWAIGASSHTQRLPMHLTLHTEGASPWPREGDNNWMDKSGLLLHFPFPNLGRQPCFII